MKKQVISKRFLSLTLAFMTMLSLIPSGVFPLASAADALPTSVQVDWQKFRVQNNGNPYYSQALDSNVYIRDIPVTTNDGSGAWGFCYAHGKALKNRGDNTWNYIGDAAIVAARPFLDWYSAFTAQGHWDALTNSMAASWVQVAIWLEQEGKFTDYNDDAQLLLLAQERENVLDKFGYSVGIDESLSVLAAAIDMFKAGTYGEWTYRLYNHSSDDAQQPLLVAQHSESPPDNYDVYVKLSKTNDSGGYLAGATFGVYHDSACTDEADRFTTGSSQWSTSEIIQIDSQQATLYVKEISAPGSYTKDTGVYSVSVDSAVNNTAATAAVVVGNGSGGTIVNTVPQKPNSASIIQKVDAFGSGLGGATFSIVGDAASGGYVNKSVTTDSTGSVKLQWLDSSVADYIEPGYYMVTEEIAPAGYEIETQSQYIKLWLEWVRDDSYPAGGYYVPHNSGPIVFVNYAEHTITVKKLNESGKGLAGTVFQVYLNGIVYATKTSNSSGSFTLENVGTGLYTIVESTPTSGYLRSTYGYSKEVYVDLSDTSVTSHAVTFTNYQYPEIIIEKYDADTKRPLANTAFRVSIDGTILGTFQTNSSGAITISYAQYGAFLNSANDSWTVLVEEITPTNGYFISDPNWQVQEIRKGQSATPFIFQDNSYPEIRIEKRDIVTEELLAGATFHVTIDGVTFGSFVTDASGQIVISYDEFKDFLNGANDGWTIRVEETAAPKGYFLSNPSWQENQLLKGQSLSTFVFKDKAYPEIVIEKRDSATNELLKGASFEVALDGATMGTFTTDETGRIRISYAVYGGYLDERNETWAVRVEEVKPPDGYLGATPAYQENQMKKGQDLSPFVFVNERKPNLEILKYGTTEADGDVLLSGVTYRVWQQGNETTYRDVKTDSKGRIYLEALEPGYWRLQEIATVSPYQLDDTIHTIELVAGQTATHKAVNHRRPNLTVVKTCSVTGNPLSNTKFQIFAYAEDGSETDLGIYYTDKEGKITLESLDPTRIKIVELEPTNGYAIPTGSEIQEVYLKLDEDKTVTFENVPLSAIVIHKTDTAAPSNPLEGAEFELRYLGGDTSGTGGITIGSYTTSESGSVVITGLERGYYIIEEKVPPANHSLSSETTQTVFVSGYDQDVITVTFRNQRNPGFLLIKRDAQDKAAPLSGAVYKITDSSGAVLGDNNGLFTTGSDGTIYLPNLTPSMTLLVQEVTAPKGYQLDPTVYTAKLDGTGDYELELYNTKLNQFILTKLDAYDSSPLKGVEYYITFADGTTVQGGSNGYFYTDEAGRITITDLPAGTVLKIKETKTSSDRYILDTTVYTYTIAQGTNAKTFTNERKGGILLMKRDAQDNHLLSGVQFKFTYANGQVVGSANGIYTTDSSGQIRIPEQFAPNTVIKAIEVKAKSGYQRNDIVYTFVIEDSDTMYIQTAYNEPIGGVELIKVDADSNSTRIADIEFELRHMNGGYIGAYTTDRNGKISVSLEDGWYTFTEISTGKTDYILDPTPINFEVRNGEITTLRVKNTKASRILIHKVDSLTGAGIAGVKFLLMDKNKNPLMLLVTDQDGYCYVDASDELTEGKYFLREYEAAAGYILDEQIKTVYLEAGKKTEITWQNTAIRGQIQMIKKSADDNPINGLPAGSLLSGAVFEVYDKAGNKVDTIVTDTNGRAVSQPLPLSRYTIREVKAPDYYSINDTVMTAYLEYSGQIITFEVANRSVNTGVNIKKTGPLEAMSNQPMKYTFAGIGNTSSVPLESFYWRDALPAEVQLMQIVTGTYNQALSYKVVYLTNTNGSYQTLADNLSTSRNYVLDASPTALGLASNERVTEVMFVFGTVKAGFGQVETPCIYGQAVSGLAGGSGFVNVADVGGVYNGRWIMHVSRWTTKVYGTTTITLPKTGY